MKLTFLCLLTAAMLTSCQTTASPDDIDLILNDITKSFTIQSTERK